jgi:hypothetical protein
MPPPSERGSILGTRFDAWFLRACNRDRSKRFASAFEQVEALAVALGFPEQARISDSAPRTLVSAALETFGSAATLNALSSDLTAGQKRRRYLGGFIGAIAALGFATLVWDRQHRNEAAIHPSHDAAVPSVAASALLASSSAPPVTSAKPSIAADASAPLEATEPSPASSKKRRPADSHKPASPTAAPHEKPSTTTPGNTVWGER